MQLTDLIPACAPRTCLQAGAGGPEEEDIGDLKASARRAVPGMAMESEQPPEEGLTTSEIYGQFAMTEAGVGMETVRRTEEEKITGIAVLGERPASHSVGDHIGASGSLLGALRRHHLHETFVVELMPGTSNSLAPSGNSTPPNLRVPRRADETCETALIHLKDITPRLARVLKTMDYAMLQFQVAGLT